LVERGVEVSEIRHLANGTWQRGAHPKRGDYESFADFNDPDGNGWILQERGHGGPR
ncbi:MAG TPA: VOC family protein, partial [Actinomycetes bacterium]